ncbi:hypothetical protein HDU67_010318 [Dinochytrium kinnereticum]|nr:hypothetical protein HDU67_010318 [Dinochytrium kinnereticum]
MEDDMIHQNQADLEVFKTLMARKEDFTREIEYERMFEEKCKEELKRDKERRIMLEDKRREEWEAHFKVHERRPEEKEDRDRRRFQEMLDPEAARESRDAKREEERERREERREAERERQRREERQCLKDKKLEHEEREVK